jgi:hypothetical protein
MTLTHLQKKGYSPDKKIRLASCDEVTDNKGTHFQATTWYQTDGSRCENIQSRTKEELGSTKTFGPFYGVFTSPDEPGPGLNLAHNVYNEDIYGSKMLKCLAREQRAHPDVNGGAPTWKELFLADPNGNDEKWDKESRVLSEFELEKTTEKCFGYSYPAIIKEKCPEHPECEIIDEEPPNVKGGGLEWAPHMRQVVQQAASGYTIVLFGYGYSGSGKTYTLLGGGKTMGVMTLGLQDLQDQITEIVAIFKELYGQIDISDGRPMIGETGIYSYEIQQEASDGMPEKTYDCTPKPGEIYRKPEDLHCVRMYFWGRRFKPTGDPKKGNDMTAIQVPPLRPSEHTDIPYGDTGSELLGTDFKAIMAKHPTALMLDKIGPGSKNTVGEWIDKALKLIMNTRMHARCRDSFDLGAPDDPDAGDERCRHVRKTPNNPESSRGHLFTILDVAFKGEEKGKIVVVDCAGSEDPVAIMKDYVDFKLKSDGESQGDARAAFHLKKYNMGELKPEPLPGGGLAVKLRLWFSDRDEFLYTSSPIRQMQNKVIDWVKINALEWLKSQDDDSPRLSWGTDRYTKAQLEAQPQQLVIMWAYNFLYRKGILAMVKEGVFINESLQHLKQFLLFRAQKTKSLMELNIPKKTGEGLQRIDEDGTSVELPGFGGMELPIVQNWVRSVGLKFPDDCNGNSCKKFGIHSTEELITHVMYSPKQFIKADSYLQILQGGSAAWGQGEKPETKKNTQPLISTARCAFNWEIPEADTKFDTAYPSDAACRSDPNDGAAYQANCVKGNRQLNAQATWLKEKALTKPC